MLQADAPPASLTQQAEPVQSRVELPVVTLASGFVLPRIASFPPFYTRQQNGATWATQSTLWSQLILSFCRFHRIYRVDLGPSSLAAGSPRLDLWSNQQLNRKLDVALQRELLDTMVAAGTASFDPPVTKNQSNASGAFIYWRSPSEWGELIYSWIAERGLTNSIMTFFELASGGEIAETTEWSDMPYPFLRVCLLTLVKSGRAQVFKGTEAGEEGDGIKFFSQSST